MSSLAQKQASKRGVAFGGAGRSRGRRDVVAVVDLGGAKISCFVGRAPESSSRARAPVRVIGVGHQVSRGVRNGAIVDLDEAEDALRAAVDSAERMAGVTLRDVYVSSAFGKLRSRNFGVEVSIAGHGVTDDDLQHVLSYAAEACTPADSGLAHAFPTGYSIDGSRGVSDPRGMFGETLSVNMHVVSAPLGPLRNIETCVKRCHLAVAGYVAAPFAAGLSCLVSDEMELGVTCVDMGGDTTSFAVFAEGALVYCDVAPIGGRHITADIARGLATSVSAAERLKTFYGSALPGASDERELIDVPAIGGEAEAVRAPRSLLNGVIRPRLEETFELLRDRLREAGADEAAGRRVVLTGGASQLTGVRELAARVLQKQVRLGRPLSSPGLAESASGPAFAASTGALDYAVYGPSSSVFGAEDVWASAAGGRKTGLRGPMAKVGAWMKENL
ncbi:MAG: cell division protein FtsA [Pseudomonadota bacterium]